MSGQVRLWLAVIAVLALLPHVPGLDSDFGRSLLSQMGIAVVFALSYNVLFGQTGLLSFGHAVYFGLGGYVAIHVMRAINLGLPLPMPLVPLAGAAGGLLFGALFGAVTTRRAGTIFALISLGVGELVYAATFMLPGFFGGEEGITASRTKGHALGLQMGSQLAVYYLIALWALIAAWLMRAFGRTPVGRMCFAVRDNAERAEFVGYNTQGVRFFAFAVAGLFAGLAGGLHAINYEIVAADAVSAQRSGTVLLMAYIGGAAHFAGPILGAVTLTWLQTSLSGYTSAWLLYLGLFLRRDDPVRAVGPVRPRPDAPPHRAHARVPPRSRFVPDRARSDYGPCVRRDRAHRDELSPRDPARARHPHAPARYRARRRRTVALAHRIAHARGRISRFPCDMAPRRGSVGPRERRGTRKYRMSALALQLRDLHKSFGATPIIRGVSLDIVEGERHAIIGPNGAGKSTLFNLISGRMAPTSGSVHLHGAPIEGMQPYAINRRGLARSFQVTNIFPRLTVFENIRCSLLWSLGYKYNFWRRADALADATERTDATLERIRMTARRDTLAGVLTYAEQRALEIGITIAGDADVILLDEPTAGMSRGEADNAVALIRAISEGRTLLMVEHDMGVVFDLADRISVLVYGQVLATDTPQRVRANEAVQAAYLGSAAHA